MRDGKESRKHEIGNAAPFAVGTRRGIKRRGDETLPFFFKERTEPRAKKENGKEEKMGENGCPMDRVTQSKGDLASLVKVSF